MAALGGETIFQNGLQDTDNKGRWIRKSAGFRNIISKTDPHFQPEFGRYHLYVSYACPWANRTIAVINVKGLRDCVTMSAVHPTWQRTRPDSTDDLHIGWTFGGQVCTNVIGLGKFKGCGTEDEVNGAKFLRDIYEMAQDETGKYSTPVLWDKKLLTIVNNESSEIMRMLSSEFNDWATGPLATLDLYPVSFRTHVDAANDWIYRGINDCVYKCGFAKTQVAYDEAIDLLIGTLAKLEILLSTRRYVVGPVFTEADIRLFMSLVRFDEVYVVYFKCNIVCIRELPNIVNYCRDVYQIPGMAESIRMDDIKEHYFS